MATRLRASDRPALVPMTIVHQGVPLDVTLPSGLPVVEILPVLAERLGGLGPDASAYGLCLVSESGTLLDDSRSLESQQVAPGTVLTLEVRSMEAEPRYDDLVEAVASAVERQQTAWEPQDTMSMSVASTCLLFFVGAFMLLYQGPGDWFVPLSSGIATIVLCLATYAIVHTGAKGAWAVASTAGVLAGVTLYTTIQGPAAGSRMALAGLGAAVAICVCIPALKDDRPLTAGPLLVCFALMATSSGHHALGYPLLNVVTVVCAGAAGISLLAPWVSLASVPVTISLPNRPVGYHRADNDSQINLSLTARVMNMQGLVLSVRVACSVIVLACTPILASAGIDGVVLVIVIAAAAMLSTRSVRSKADVTAGVVGGMLILVTLALIIAMRHTELVMLIVVLVGVMGVVVLLLNVLGPSYRPRLARVTDAVEIMAITAIAPLAALVLGVL